MHDNNLSDLSQEQSESLRSVFLAECFPGLSVSLSEVVFMMAASDPASAIMSQVINTEGEVHRLLQV